LIDRLFENVTPDDVARLIAGGETQQVEFKENMRTILDLAKIASAFGNTQGGVLLVGVREPDVVVGTDVRRLGHLVDQLGGRIRPMPETRLHPVTYQGQQVGVVVFKPVAGEIAISDAGAFVRRGEAIRVMEADEIRQRLPREETPQQAQVTNEHLAEGIATLSATLEGMREDLRYAQSLRGQWKVLLVGFLLGIAASVIASFIYAYLTLPKT
jgi:predicted HTH transcriptional regulator